MRFTVQGVLKEVERRQDRRGRDYYLLRVLQESPLAVVPIISEVDGFSPGSRVVLEVDVVARDSRLFIRHREGYQRTEVD